MDAKQTPLIDLLESVPADARVVYEYDKFHSQSIPVGRLCHEAATALRTALAEPVQEPLPKMRLLPCCGYHDGRAVFWNRFNGVVQCHSCGQQYAPHPPQRKPLADKEIDSVTIEQWGEMKGYPLAAHRAFARAIERAHGIGGEA